MGSGLLILTVDDKVNHSREAKGIANMTTEERKVLRELRFTGGRFEETEGWLDLDVLSELLDYQKILFATIRETWLLEHQGRERLPRRFAQDFRLGISEIGAGSC